MLGEDGWKGNAVFAWFVSLWQSPPFPTSAKSEDTCTEGKGHWTPKGQPNILCAREEHMADWKKACRTAKKKQSQEKAHAGRGQEPQCAFPVETSRTMKVFMTKADHSRITSKSIQYIVRMLLPAVVFSLTRSASAQVTYTYTGNPFTY